MRRLPATVTAMLPAAGFETRPPNTRENPIATQITSVQTIAVELATEVLFSDSNHVVKCSARKIPLTAHSATVFRSAAASSCRSPRKVPGNILQILRTGKFR